MRDPDTLTPSEKRWSLAGILIAISMAGMGMGLIGPLYSYAFENAGYPRSITGLASASFALAIVIFAPIVPGLMRRLGTVNVLWFAMAAVIVFLVLFRLTDNVYLWFLSRFAMGLGVTALFVATEIWVNLIAHEENRGKVLGVYAFCLSSGFTMGLVVLYLVGSTGWAPVMVTSTLFVLAMLVLIPARPLSPSIAQNAHHGPILFYLRQSPTPLVAAIVFGAVEMGILNLLNVYGVRAGMMEASATLMLISTAAGNLVGPMTLGYLADKMDRRRLLLLSAGVGAIAALLIPVAVPNPLVLHALLFITGGITVGLYTVGLTLLGERFKGQELAGANAAFVTMYGIGALFGPAMGGVAMDIWDPNGLMVVFFALCGGYSLMIFARIRRSASLTGGSA